MTKANVLCAVSFNWHDSSVSYAIGDQIVLVLEAERFFRAKRKSCTAEEMETLIAYGAQVLGLGIDDIDHWALTSLNTPWLSETQIQKLAQRDYYWDDAVFLGKTRRCLIVGHHYAHAAAFYASTYENAIVQTCDGGGDFHERVAAFAGDGLVLERLDTRDDEAITALPYHLITGFFYRERFCEGKAMALAAFGTYSHRHAALIHAMLPALNDGCAEIARGDGEDEARRKFAAGMDRVDTLLGRDIGHLFAGVGRFAPEALDFIATFQSIFAARRTADIRKLAARYGAPPVVLAGGACLNLAANTAIYENGVDRLFIPPNCDDTGQSFGALCKLITVVCAVRPNANLPFVGMGSNDIHFGQLDLIADLLFKGETIFLHNGKAEVGPRALGHRTIMARADLESKKKETSELIKQREPYRPVAPITTQAAVLDHFEGPTSSPYMMHSYKVKSASAGRLAGVTHVDGTARAQTVTPESDPFMHELLKRYQERSGTPVLLNTSLNLKGQPISNDIGHTQDMAKECERRGLKVSIVYNGAVL